MLGIAEQIAVRPCGADAATQVGGIGRGKPNRMAQAFVRIEGERNPAESVELVCGLHGDAQEDAEREKILTRFFDLARTIPLAGMDQEPSPDDALVDLLQAADGDFADVYARACVHGQGHVQHLGGRVFIRHRRIDGGERVTVFLERRK